MKQEFFEFCFLSFFLLTSFTHPIKFCIPVVFQMQSSEVETFSFRCRTQVPFNPSELLGYLAWRKGQCEETQKKVQERSAGMRAMWQELNWWAWIVKNEE